MSSRPNMLGYHNCVAVLMLLLLTFPSSLGRLTNYDKEIRDVLKELIVMELEDYNERKMAKDLQTWLNTTNEDLRIWRNKLSVAEWNYVTNITDYNRQQLSETETNFSAWYPDILEQLHKLGHNHLDSNTERQLRLLGKYAESSNPEEVSRQKDLESRMSGIYSTARACVNRETCLQMEPGLQDVMANSRNPAQLERAWKAWRDATGPKIKPLYLEFVDLANKGAQEQGYDDYGQYWRDDQFDQTSDIEAMCDELWLAVKPLYVQLHAYVRRKLREYYGESVVGTDGTIPAHLLGNMWAQNWQMIADIVFPPATSQGENIAEVAEENLKENYDVKELFKLAEEFYTSIGLFPLTDTFWNKSMLVKPDDREVTCHASASDLFAEDDFRIKMCTELTMDYLYTIHHELGHIEYFMAYSHQPAIYRTGANAAFHEAVGDTMTLSVFTRKHLKTIGLINEGEASKEDDIADLLNMALSKIAFLPYGYLMDKWRWRVFSKDIPEEELNHEYWKLRLEYQGIVAPVPRSEADFDPAAKYHIPSNSPYMVYFISFIAQFQFYKSLCDYSGHKGELHTCDFYRSKVAGGKLREMLELGQSVPWPEALEKLTGTRKITVDPLLEYFQPLTEWLEEENKGEELGWDDADINWQE